MRPIVRGLLVLVPVALVLGGLIVFAAEPLLWAPEQGPAGTDFHDNPALLKAQAASSAGDLVPLMQAVLDGQEPVIAGIRDRDADIAERDLTAYDDLRVSLNDTALRLDVNGGEIDTFLAATESQEFTLRELINRTAAFDAVQKVGAREENLDNRELQASVASQGAKLRNGIRALATNYTDDHDTVMNISRNMGLDTRQYAAARTAVEDLAQDIETEPLPNPDPEMLRETGITFFTEPEQAAYREPVRVFGIVSPPGMAREISVSLDNASIISVESDMDGNYFATITVERVRAGTHLLAGRTGALVSEQRLLQVTETATVTSIEAAPVILNGSVTGAFANGSVMANNPVRNAPVSLRTDSGNATGVTTAGDGTFSAFLPLPPGSHTIRAVFSADGFPLSPSASNAVDVTVRAPLLRLPAAAAYEDALPLYGGIVLAIAAAGGLAFWYSRRSTTPEEDRIRAEIEELVAAAEREPAESEKGAELRQGISILMERYWQALTRDGLSDAAREAYLALAGRIAGRLDLKAYRALTPRELSVSCATERYSVIFGRFVRMYERIRYGGRRGEQDRKRFEHALQNADRVTGGDEH